MKPLGDSLRKPIMHHTSASSIEIEDPASSADMTVAPGVRPEWTPCSASQEAIPGDEYLHGAFARGVCWLVARFLCLMGCLLIGYTIYKQLADGYFATIQMWTNASSSATLALLGVWAHLHSQMKAGRRL